jgi:hypothetical protein
VENERVERDRIERASLIDWICVRASHHGPKPVDPSTPLTIHEDGHWSFCPAGLADDADHLWYATGGVTRKALERFRWPTESDVSGSE